MPILTISFWFFPIDPNQDIRLRKKKKQKSSTLGVIWNFLFVDDRIIHIENPMEPPPQIIRMNKWVQQVYKIQD